MNFRVVFTEEAERNTTVIRDWLYNRSPDGALHWLEALDGARSQHCHNPISCSLAPEDAYASRELRNILFKTPRGRVYRAVFYVSDETVTVTHIRGPSQRLLPPEAFDRD